MLALHSVIHQRHDGMVCALLLGTAVGGEGEYQCDLNVGANTAAFGYGNPLAPLHGSHRCCSPRAPAPSAALSSERRRILGGPPLTLNQHFELVALLAMPSYRSTEK